MKQPLVVYLDSSDFSNLGRLITGEQWSHAEVWTDILCEIEKAVANRTAEFRFSHIHIAEIVHSDLGSKIQASSRAAAITRICGEKCLRYSPDVFIEECVNLVDRTGNSLNNIVYQDRFWFPDIDPVLDGLGEEIKSSLRKSISSTGLPRPQRRRLEKSLLTREGKLIRHPISSGFELQMREAIQTFSREWMLSPRMIQEDLLLRFLHGEISETVIGIEFINSLSNVSAFVSRYFDLVDDKEPISGWLRGFGQSLVDSLLPIRQLVKELAETQGEQKASIDLKIALDGKEWAQMMTNLRRQVLDSIWAAGAKKFRYHGINRNQWDRLVVPSKMGSLPALDTLLQAFDRHARQNISASTNTRALRQSDGGDLMHMCYIPYVNVFRCDGYAGQIARPLAEKTSTRVAPKIGDLLDILRSLR